MSIPHYQLLRSCILGRITISTLFCTLAMVVLSPITASAAPAQVSSGVAGYRAEDPRLERKVDIRGHSVSVARLLELLTAQSGVRLELSKIRDGAGDDRVSFAFPGVTVGDAMEALWGLLSYSDAHFIWHQSGHKDAPVYELWMPIKAQQLPQRLQAYADAAFERQLLLLNRAARVSKPELDQIALEHEVVRIFAQSGMMLPGVRLFFDVLTPEEQRRVIDGTAEVEKDARTLPEYGQVLIERRFNQSGRMGTFGRTVDPILGPKWVRFYTRTGRPQLTKTLFIELEGLGAHGYVGGTPLDNELTAALYALWMLPGDAPADDLERTVLPPIPAARVPAGKAAVPQTQVAQRADDLAEISPIPFLARLRPGDPQDPGPVAGAALGDVLQRFCVSRNNYQKKWRNGVLLLTAPDWYRAPYQAMKLPATTTRAVGEILRQSNGFPSLEELQRLAELLSVDQAAGLSTEVSLFEQVREWHDLLMMRRIAPVAWRGLESRTGLSLAAANTTLGPLLEKDAVKSLLTDSDTAALQIVYRVGPGERQEETRYIVLQSLDKQGQPLHGTGFGYKKELVPWWTQTTGPAWSESMTAPGKKTPPRKPD
jgi:hypothetical protein